METSGSVFGVVVEKRYILRKRTEIVKTPIT